MDSVTEWSEEEYNSSEEDALWNLIHLMEFEEFNGQNDPERRKLREKYGYSEKEYPELIYTGDIPNNEIGVSQV